MACNLCTEVVPDPTKLISILSDEGRRLQLRQILLQHLEINTTFQNVHCICRTCSDILCAFHGLYIHVKSKGDAAAVALDSCHQSDSDEPLAVLCKEFKFESCNLKSELRADWHTATSTGKPEQQRRSRRLVARASKGGIIEQEQHRTVVEVEEDLAVKEEANEELSVTFEMALSDVDAAPHSAGAASEDEANTVNVLPACDMLQLDNAHQRCTTTRRRGRAKKVIKTKAAATPPSVQQTHKTQITKEYDEYLANNFKLSCCLCQVPIANFMVLKTHFRAKHQMRGYVLCCGKKLLKRGVLVDHIRTHFDPDYFKCGICQKVASDQRCLEMHMSRHGQQRERNFKCDVCFKSYFRRSIFMRHMLLHVPEDQKKVHCPQCEKVFATKYIMNQHLKLVHLNMYAKICDICGKSIRGRDAFQRHQLEHAGQPKPLVPCEECGLKFSNKYGLSRHMKVMHSAENLRTQVCSICSKISPNMSAHRRHMNYVHTMERKHACPMCEKAFKRRNDLKEHMTTHTGEVLYTCPHCPKTFNSNANMHSHRKKYHRKEWEEKRLQRIPHATAAAMPQSEPAPNAELQFNSDDTQQRHELVKYNNNNS